MRDHGFNFVVILFYITVAAKVLDSASLLRLNLVATLIENLALSAAKAIKLFALLVQLGQNSKYYKIILANMWYPFT